MNWVDTAPAYGNGHSEEIVARALADLPAVDRPYVFTKCGMVFTSGDARDFPERIGRPESIRAECDASLRRLGVERIDLLQMHWPPQDGTRVEEYWGALLQLKEDGKIRAAGLSNHGIDELAATEAVGHVDTLQPHLSAIDRDFAGAERRWCIEHDTGVIVYSPMESGLLTGKYTAERVAEMADDDWRKRDSQFTENLSANNQVAAALAEVADRHGVSQAAAAAAWTLAWPGVTAAIVGARSPEQVDEWVSAGFVSLAAEDIAAVAVAIDGAGAGSGPVQP